MELRIGNAHNRRPLLKQIALLFFFSLAFFNPSTSQSGNRCHKAHNPEADRNPVFTEMRRIKGGKELYLPDSVIEHARAKTFNQLVRAAKVYHEGHLTHSKDGKAFTEIPMPHELVGAKRVSQLIAELASEYLLFISAHRGINIPAYDGVIVREDQTVARMSLKNIFSDKPGWIQVIAGKLIEKIREYSSKQTLNAKALDYNHSINRVIWLDYVSRTFKIGTSTILSRGYIFLEKGSAPIRSIDIEAIRTLLTANADIMESIVVLDEYGFVEIKPQ